MILSPFSYPFFEHNNDWVYFSFPYIRKYKSFRQKVLSKKFSPPNDFFVFSKEEGGNEDGIVLVGLYMDFSMDQYALNWRGA